MMRHEKKLLLTDKTSALAWETKQDFFPLVRLLIVNFYDSTFLSTADKLIVYVNKIRASFYDLV